MTRHRAESQKCSAQTSRLSDKVGQSCAGHLVRRKKNTALLASNALLEYTATGTSRRTEE